jgi:putative NIF3 family GTP cyclohydrolase 1 type 2
MSTSIQQVIDAILAATPYQPGVDTVDTVKIGDATQPIRGIATTFLATCEVIEQAAASGANLLITHEPTFYNHRDDTDWLAHDPVYAAKRALIEQHELVIWRFHDFWHARQPDGIYVGVLRALGWQADADAPHICTLPPTALADLAAQLKQQLGVPMVRMAGDPALLCRRIGLLVGAIGGRVHISVLGRDDIDALVCGEIAEWETCEYVRDAERLGLKKGLIVIGHEPSEEAGMAYLAEWLRERLPGVPAIHIPAGNPLAFA